MSFSYYMAGYLLDRPHIYLCFSFTVEKETCWHISGSVKCSPVYKRYKCKILVNCTYKKILICIEGWNIIGSGVDSRWFHGGRRICRSF